MNYKTFLHEFFNNYIGPNSVTRIKEDIESFSLPEEEFDKVKDLFKIIYEYLIFFNFFKELVDEGVFLTILRPTSIRGSIEKDFLPTILYKEYKLKDLNNLIKDFTNKDNDINHKILKINENLVLDFFSKENVINIRYNSYKYNVYNVFIDLIPILNMIIIEYHSLSRNQVENILNKESFQESLKELYIMKGYKISLNKFLTIDFDREIVNTKYRLETISKDIDYKNEDLEKLIYDLEKLHDQKGELNILLQEYQIKKTTQKGVDEEEIKDFLTNFEHYLIKDFELVLKSNNMLRVNLLTKPIPLSTWNQSPKNKVMSSTGSPVIAELFEDIYLNKGPARAFYSPYLISFDIGKHSNKIYNYEIKPIVNKYSNPHEAANCFGGYSNLKSEAMIEGNIKRFIHIMLAYLQTTTLGDVAGDGFLNRTIIDPNYTGGEKTWEEILLNKDLNLQEIEKIYLESKNLLENQS